MKCHWLTVQKLLCVCALTDDFCLVHSMAAYIHCYRCFSNGVLRSLPPPWYSIGTVLEHVKDENNCKKKKREFVKSLNCYPYRTRYGGQIWIKNILISEKWVRCKICTLAVKMTGNDERLRCLTLINNICRSILQQLAVNDNSSGFQELTMHSGTWTRPTAAATTGWLGHLQLDVPPAGVPIVVFFTLSFPV